MTAISGDTVTMIIDIGAVLLVLLCMLIGMYRGMIRMLSGLAVLILALVGATFVSEQFTDTVTDVVTPMVESHVTGAVEDAMEGQDFNQLISGYAEDAGLEEALEENKFSSLRFDYLSELFERFKSENTLPQTITETLQERFDEMRRSFTGTISQALSSVLREIVRPLVHGLLFAFSFIVLSFVLKIVFHSLDAVETLPGLHSVNAMGGLILGFMQGVIFLIVAAFVVRFVFSGVEGVSDSRALRFLSIWFPSLSFQ